MSLTKEVILKGISEDWLRLLDNPQLDDIIQQLNQIPTEDITPCPSLIMEFARLCSFDKIRVVIIGQDPYPKAGDAHGLAFSCLTSIPGSLKNIYKALKHSKLISFIPTSGNLTYWAKQGVLLINTALTTQIGTPCSHTKQWEVYINKLINDISNIKRVVMINGGKKILRPMFLLWGKHAQNKKQYIDEHCTVMEWAHPSPLAQSRCSFKECDHFLRVNAVLHKCGLSHIDWNQAPVENEIELTLGLNPGRDIVVFTDGSCHPNKSCKESRAGYAAVFALGAISDITLYGNIDTESHFASSQRGEGAAIFKSMEYLSKKLSTWDRLIIITDSDFWIQMFQVYMPSWVDREIPFTEKKNADMTVPMWQLYYDLIYLHGKTIEFRHIKSHDKDKWSRTNPLSYEFYCYQNNEYADKMAGYARKELEPGQHIVEQDQ